MRFSHETDIFGTLPAWVLASLCIFIINSILWRAIYNENVPPSRLLLARIVLVLLTGVFLVFNYVAVAYSLTSFEGGILSWLFAGATLIFFAAFIWLPVSVGKITRYLLPILFLYIAICAVPMFSKLDKRTYNQERYQIYLDSVNKQPGVFR